MTKVKLEQVRIARNTKIKTGKGFFAQCQRCNNWVPMVNEEDENERLNIPLIQHPKEPKDNESDDDFSKRKEKAKWVCSRCWDELDDEI
jgi:hypothetical protein